MAKLLVSVRNVAEAVLAVAGGADLIDVKEPEHGPLGAADGRTIAAIVDAVGHQKPVSAAVGELTDGIVLPAALAGRLRFAKFGLAGCGEIDNWQHRWRQAVSRLPAGVQPVAVVYADYRRAEAPEPAAVLSAAQELQCAALLVDTFDKSHGSLCEALTPERLGKLVAATRRAGMLSVLAGGLSIDAISGLVPLGPDYFAVRGAVCRGGRQGPLESDRVRQLADLLDARLAPTRCRSI